MRLVLAQIVIAACIFLLIVLMVVVIKEEVINLNLKRQVKRFLMSKIGNDKKDEKHKASH